MSDEDWAPPEPTPLERATDTAPRASTVEVPGYTALHEVARGGDSIVYRARQVSLDRDVAIKVIHVADSATAARFQRELEITVRLGRAHPHIVTVLDTTTTTDGSPCLIMDFHDLGSLHDRLLSHGPLPISEVVEAGTAVADALAFAHAAGVLHRDVKPQNVLLLPTSYVLSDFGIARMADAGHTASLERFSYRHASPQVLDGLAPTVTDDVWSLGSTLFTLLEGRAPFAADDPDDDTALAYLRRVRTGRRRPLRRDDLPEGLRDLVEGCLVADREERVGTADLALARLRALRTEGRSWEPGAAATGSAPAPSATQAGPSGGSASAVRPGVAPAASPVPTPIGERPAPTTSAAADPSAATAFAEPSAPTAPPPEAGFPEPGASTAPSSGSTTAASASAVPALDSSAAPPAPTPGATSASTQEPSSAATPSTHAAPPVARSALADLDGDAGAAGPSRGGPEDDAEATGLVVPGDQSGEGGAGASATTAAAGGPDGAGGRAERGGWRRIAAFIGGMLLAGAAIGVGAALLRDGDAPEQPPPPTDEPVPTATGPVPGQTGPPQASVSDPALAPQGFAVAGQGTSALLTWAPPSGSIDFLVVVSLVDDEEPVVVANLAADAQEYTVEGLDPDSPACFAVVGYGRSDGAVEAGSSAEECTG